MARDFARIKELAELKVLNRTRRKLDLEINGLQPGRLDRWVKWTKIVGAVIIGGTGVLTAFTTWRIGEWQQYEAAKKLSEMEEKKAAALKGMADANVKTADAEQKKDAAITKRSEAEKATREANTELETATGKLQTANVSIADLERKKSELENNIENLQNQTLELQTKPETRTAPTGAEKWVYLGQRKDGKWTYQGYFKNLGDSIPKDGDTITALGGSNIREGKPKYDPEKGWRLGTAVGVTRENEQFKIVHVAKPGDIENVDLNRYIWASVDEVKTP